MSTLMKELLQRNQNVKNYSELLIKRYGYNWGNIEKTIYRCFICVN